MYELAPIDGTKWGAVGYDVYRGAVRSAERKSFANIVSYTLRALISTLIKINWRDPLTIGSNKRSQT